MCILKNIIFAPIIHKKPLPRMILLRLMMAIMAITLTLPLHAQSIVQTYDASGNCISRRLVLPSYSMEEGNAATLSSADIQAYPLPVVTDILTITVNPLKTAADGRHPLTYALTGLSGQVYTYGVIRDSRTVIHVSGLPKGMYLLRVMGENASALFKVVKK